jgi:tetratricopeptide (TPR) repeat protein
LRRYDRHLYEAFPDCVNAILALNTELQPHHFRESNGEASSSSQHAEAKAAAANRGVNSIAASSSPLQAATKLLASHEYAQALQVLNALIAKEPGNSLAYNYRGYAYFGLKNYQQAVQDYTQAVRLNPQDTNAAQYLKVAKQYAGSK